MKKISISIIIMAFLIFFSIEILIHSKEVLNSVLFSIDIWKNNLFPSLFPMFVLADILINYGFVEFIGELFKPIMNYFFKAKGVCAFIFIMSIISGFPSSAKYIKELYEDGLIDNNDASKVLTFCHFSNPLFILGTVSLLLGSSDLGFLILICHYLGNIIIGLIFRNYHPTKEKDSSISIKKAIINMHNKRISNEKNAIQIITNSLIKSIDVLLLILGVVTTFAILSTILGINNYYSGFFEITQGLKYLSITDLSIELKCVLATCIISFGGLSIHMQIISILSEIKVKYFPFLCARVLHAVISSIMVLIIIYAF